jgi:hypothetical protein
MEKLVDPKITMVSEGIVERREHGLIVLSPAVGSAHDGVIALTPIAADHVSELAPKATGFRVLSEHE